MTRYIIRRVLWGVFLLVAVALITFLLFNLLPSADPAVLRAGKNSTPKVIAEIRANLGLNKPLYTQFWVYLKNLVLHFNLGYSYYSDESVLSLITDRLPATISLTVGAVIIWLSAALVVGVISAVRARTWLDRSAMGTALVLVSHPCTGSR